MKEERIENPGMPELTPKHWRDQKLIAAELRGMFQNHRNPAKNTKKSKRERTKPSQFTSAFSKYI